MISVKKIVITNAYTWYNKGDAGILLAIVDCLKKIYKNPEFIIFSFTPEEDKKRYCKDSDIKNVYSNILNPHPYKNGKLGKLFAIVKLCVKLLWIQFQLTVCKQKCISKYDQLRALEQADIIIVCGGGFLGGKKYHSLMHLYQIYIDTLFKKPVYVMGTSIEPIKSNVVKYYTNKVLSRVDYVFAREKITEIYLSSILPPDKYCLIPDMAFMLDDKIANYKFITDLKNKGKLVFGITVRNWNFPNEIDKKKAKDRYIKSIAEMMERIIQKYNACFIFVPQVTVNTGNDSLIAIEIKKLLPQKFHNQFIIRTDDWSPSEIKSVIGNMDLFVGTRMHSNIFATSMCIPTTAIAYEKKTNGIMEMLGLDDYIVEIDSISSTKLINKIELMIKDKKEIQKHLKKIIPKIRREIMNKLIENIEK